MATFILLIVDALILMLLLRVLALENASFLASLIAALLGAFGAMILTRVFTPVGPNAAIVAGLLVAIGIGIGISLVFNVGLINSIIIGIAFLLVRSGVYYLLASVMRA